MDKGFLNAALAGYEHHRAEIQARIAELQRELKGSGSPSPFSTVRSGGSDGVPTPFSEAPQPRRRRMSAAARKRIAAAQKKRWAAYHKAHQQPASRKTAAMKKSAPVAKKAAPKRKISAEQRAALIERLKNARAAKAKKAATGA